MTITKINRVYNVILDSGDNPEPEVDLQSKSIEITENGSMIVEPDSDYDGLSSVSITTSVPQPLPYDPPEYDITKFNFVYKTDNTTWGYRNNIFNGNSTIYKSNGSYSSRACFILQNNNTIILNYGIPPVNSYYCNNNTSSSDYNIYYNNNKLCNNIRLFLVEGRDHVHSYEYIPSLTLFGKLINLPN